jgi:hypothetical protein
VALHLWLILLLNEGLVHTGTINGACCLLPDCSGSNPGCLGFSPLTMKEPSILQLQLRPD